MNRQLSALVVVVSLATLTIPAALLAHDPPVVQDPGGGGGDCKPPTTNPPKCSECQAYCDCVYAKALKNCGNNVTCKDTATGEHNACLGGCYGDCN